MNEFSKYVGLDTHKETIAVAIADVCGGKARYCGKTANTSEAINKLVTKLSADGDALSFCCLDRAGELTPVRVPNQEQEAMRDLTRLREDMKGLEHVTKQHLNAFLLRYSRHYNACKSRWTQAHFRWMEGLKFGVVVQQIVFQEYRYTVR